MCSRYGNDKHIKNDKGIDKGGTEVCFKGGFGYGGCVVYVHGGWGVVIASSKEKM